MKRTTRLSAQTLAAGFLASVLLTGCGSAASSSSEGLANLKVAGIGNFSSSLTQQVAIEEGLYEKHGLDVQFVPTASGPASAALLTSGGADIGYISGPQVLTISTSGKAVKFLQDGELSNIEVIGLASEKGEHADKAYPDNFLELKGKTVGVTALGSAVDTLLREMIRDAGLDPSKDVTIIATGAPPQTLAALKQGQIQYTINTAALTRTTFAGALETYVVGNSENKNVGAGGEELVVWTPAVLEETTNKRAEDLKSYCSAMDETIAWMNRAENFGRVVSVAQEWLGLDANQAETAVNAILPSQYDALTKEIWEGNAALFPDLEGVSYEQAVWDGCAASAD